MDLLNNLRVFIRVVDCASFTAAADTLDLSTAQVSRLVADLEGHLQARLLQRTTRRLSLTEAGERFLLPADRRGNGRGDGRGPGRSYQSGRTPSCALHDRPGRADHAIDRPLR